MHRSCLPLVVLPLLAGCQEATSPDPSFTVRDSAGIEIVESSAPQLDPGSWTVSPEPVLQIGEAEGDEHYLFSRITDRGGAIRLLDGRLAVCDNQDKTIRLFDEEGHFLSQFGGKGDGPGEFSSNLLGCVRFGDGLAVLESYHVSFFDSNGRFLKRSVDLQIPPAFGVAGLFPDGSLLFYTLDPSFDPMSGVPGQPSRFPAGVRVQDPQGQVSDWELATYLNMFTPKKGGGTIAGQPFGPVQVLLTLQDGFLYGWGESSYELTVFNREGQPTRTIKRRWEPELLTPMDRDSTSHAPPPEHYAAFDLGLLDTSGNVWVRLVHPERKWDVFDPPGRWLATVTMPQGLAIHDIGEDYVLGVRKGEMDVPYVRLYELDRGSLP